MHLCISGIRHEKCCPDFHFIPHHAPQSSKEVFAVAEKGGEHLLWEQLYCGSSCRKWSEIVEESQNLTLLLSLFFFSYSEQNKEKGLPS